MDREEALKKASRANVQIIAGMGMLLLASLNVNKVIGYLQGVLPRDKIVSVADQAPEDTKEALEAMLEDYSSKVN